MDSRFEGLMNATSKALNVKTDKSDTQSKLNVTRLRTLFASAQMADLQLKYEHSIECVGQFVLSHTITESLPSTVEGCLVSTTVIS